MFVCFYILPDTPKNFVSYNTSLIASIMIGTIIGTLILDNTLNALALISWFGSCKEIKKELKC